MQREIQVICGNVNIPNLSGFLKSINSIASENEVIIQGLNADLIAGERHLHFAVGKKPLRAIGCRQEHSQRIQVSEIMRYASGEKGRLKGVFR